MADLVNTYDLSPVPNVCNQVLREIISLPKVSLAHVTMKGGNQSFWHQHQNMDEIYYSLSGEGILYYGQAALQAKKHAFLRIPHNTPHKLKNIGSYKLEHLVFAAPPFLPEDVQLLDDPNFEPEPAEPKLPNLITAEDGANIYEFLSKKERSQLGFSIATGFLPPFGKAIPHYHNNCEEVYFVISGTGRVQLDDQYHDVSSGTAVHIPTSQIHALGNTHHSNNLEVLCLSSPPFQAKDFHPKVCDYK